MNLIEKILNGTITLTEARSQDLKDQVTALVQNKTLPITRKLIKLKFIKTIDVPAFKTTKAKFYTAGKNSHGLKIVFGNTKFETEILAHIPEDLNYAGSKEDLFQLSADMWDSAITNELGNPQSISIEEWAKKNASMVINRTADTKTDGYFNIQYVEAMDGRTLAVLAWFYDGGCSFDCYEIDEFNCFRADTLVVSVITGGLEKL